MQELSISFLCEDLSAETLELVKRRIAVMVSRGDLGIKGTDVTVKTLHKWTGSQIVTKSYFVDLLFSKGWLMFLPTSGIATLCVPERAPASWHLSSLEIPRILSIVAVRMLAQSGELPAYLNSLADAKNFTEGLAHAYQAAAAKAGITW